MNVTLNKKESIIYLVVSGEIDACSSITLDNAINQCYETGENKIIINCSELEYISSAGIGVFMSYIQNFEEKNIKMVLHSLSSNVMNAFKLIGLDMFLNIKVSESEAVIFLNGI